MDPTRVDHRSDSPTRPDPPAPQDGVDEPAESLTRALDTSDSQSPELSDSAGEFQLAPPSEDATEGQDAASNLDVTVEITGRDQPAADSRPSHPETIGPYKIERLLGAGGMGSVYLGHHVDDGQPAAVKVLPASLAREEGFIARFTREISALKKLKSPNVVKLLGHGSQRNEDDSELHFYVMEYVDGETLTERIKRERRVPWEDVIDIGMQVCHALTAAHNAGIIHRDLKPSNLMISKDGVVKLADFGVAQVFATSKLTVTGGIIGTAEYMSPEQAEGRRVTKESDIYSLGAVLYVALTGRPPFSGKTPLDIAQKHRSGQFDAPRRWVPEIPHWLDEVICQCLAKKPEDRYPSTRIVARRLEEIPKKLELARGERTGSLTAATVAADGTPRQAEGGATFAAEMMRAEIETEKRGTIVRRLLDSTWVLLSLLALVGGIGYVMSRPAEVDPQELFDRGVELSQSESITSLRTARDKYFVPLLELDADKWGPKVDEYLTKIEIEEQTRSTRSLRKTSQPTSEPYRLLQVALNQQQAGDIFGADQTLTALRALISPDEDLAQLRDEVDRIRSELATQLRQIDQTAFVRSRRELAEKLRAEGRENEADAIERALKTLYNE